MHCTPLELLRNLLYTYHKRVFLESEYVALPSVFLVRVIKDKQKDLLSFEEWKKEKGSADSRTSASNSERSGAISGNSSSNGLLHESSGHLSRYSLASQEDIAKLLKILK
jgi:hypothetical protein